MTRTIFISLVFILTKAVAAQAAPLNPNDIGIVKVDPSQWTTTHAGETTLDGMPVIVALEAVERSIELPEAIAYKVHTLVPLAPVKKQVFRLRLVARENPILQAQFPLEGRNVSVDGTVRYAFISPAKADADFQFLILVEADGSLHVTYTRKEGVSDLAQGEFSLVPLLRTLQK